MLAVSCFLPCTWKEGGQNEKVGETKAIRASSLRC